VGLTFNRSAKSTQIDARRQPCNHQLGSETGSEQDEEFKSKHWNPDKNILDRSKLPPKE